MSDFGIAEMQGMQTELQEKYKDKWEAISPEAGKNKLLWLIGEIGEVIDIIKKNGGEECSSNGEIRKKLVEELSDVLMYYVDTLSCFGITADELKESYVKKFERNMNRW